MSLDAGALYVTKAGLLDCVAQRVALTPAGLPDRVCVVPGAEVAWDDCECGQLTVHHTNLYPSRVFPEPTREPPFTKCAPPFWVVTMVVTLVRCVPTGGGDEHPPECDALEAATQIADADIEAMQVGAECCFAGRMHVVGDHFTLGPEGGCAGSALTVLVGLGNCDPECG